ncbi:Rrf2 family transcriptional regulator [Lactobacillus sp. CBA3606]|uniref:RrF2 family transcriptional regulator n=1 Tax=Lactobacillus sp. CBA3606 TaxID=2099789 RepID=UPI000CFBB630|nr:Rrf2 family transcriptional regulator [Lactobacillus sp. CBA3606]AVK64336.1 Rrf2 family transcriptional regulator [Lactobacillus sp. CBA3606]
MRLDFSVAVHSLLYLDDHRADKVSSRELAQSLHLNPVMIRNILSVLHKAGYLLGTVGKYGGYQLEKPLVAMNLGDLYDLTIPPTLSYARFITGHSRTDDEVETSPIAANLSESLTDLFTVADQQYRAYYHQFTMADLKRDTHHHGYFLAQKPPLDS